MSLAQRLIIAGGIALCGALPVGAALTAPAGISTAQVDCPAGEESDTYTGTCVPYLVPNPPCPPGVGGAECTSIAQAQTGTIGGEARPQIPAPVAGEGPESELAQVSTPDY